MNNYFLRRFITLMILIFTLGACGGGDGGGSTSPQSSSNWDEMAWDQDNWG